MNLPNQLTLLRILLTPVIVWLLFAGGDFALGAAFFVFIIASLTDWYDGYTARKYGYISTWGKFFDPLADKILVTTIFICFCHIGYFPIWMIVVIIIRDLLITILRSYAIFKGHSIGTTLLAKTKTFVQMIVLYLIFLYHLFISFTGLELSTQTEEFIQTHHVIIVLMGIVISLTVISGIAYLISNRLHIRKMWNEIYKKIVPSDI